MSAPIKTSELTNTRAFLKLLLSWLLEGPAELYLLVALKRQARPTHRWAQFSPVGYTEGGNPWTNANSSTSTQVAFIMLQTFYLPRGIKKHQYFERCPFCLPTLLLSRTSTFASPDYCFRHTTPVARLIHYARIRYQVSRSFQIY